MDNHGSSGFQQLDLYFLYLPPPETLNNILWALASKLVSPTLVCSAAWFSSPVAKRPRVSLTTTSLWLFIVNCNNGILYVHIYNKASVNLTKKMLFVYFEIAMVLYIRVINLVPNGLPVISWELHTLCVCVGGGGGGGPVRQGLPLQWLYIASLKFIEWFVKFTHILVRPHINIREIQPPPINQPSNTYRSHMLFCIRIE